MEIDLLAPRPTLVWSAYDPSGILAAALHQFLTAALPDEVATELVPLEGLDCEVAPGAGLVACRVAEPSELEPVARLLSHLRTRHRPPVRLCWTGEQTEGSLGLLVEAGAQVVVGQLPSLQAAIPRIVRHAPLENRARHPILERVRDRLPW